MEEEVKSASLNTVMSSIRSSHTWPHIVRQELGTFQQVSPLDPRAGLVDIIIETVP